MVNGRTGMRADRDIATGWRGGDGGFLIRS